MNNELYHYGVLGMKWGIRRADRSGGTITRKQARQEYRSDNKAAFEYGRKASIYGKASTQSLNRTIKYENKLDKAYAKDPEGTSRRTKKIRDKWAASATASLALSSIYQKHRQQAEDHCKSLVDKYGKEAVSSIKYKDEKIRKNSNGVSSMSVVAERTTKFSDYAIAVGGSFASTALVATGALPVGIIFVPEGRNGAANRVSTKAYTDAYSTIKRR